MHVLITGHRGFVGRHFVQRLSNKKYDITGIDIQDGNDCRDFFRQDNKRKGYWDLVIHLAAIVGGRQTIEGNPIAVATDLSIDAEMFNWAVRQKPKKVVYYSSSAAYPICCQTIERHGHKLKEEEIDLEQLAKPDFTYGWAKLTGEMLSQYARSHYGIDVAIFRPFSGYGADQDETYPFPAFIKRAKSRSNPFYIWGNGRQVRDFIHIDDVVDATLEAVRQNVDGPINLGTGRAVTFNALAKMITNKAGYSPHFIHDKEKPVGVHYRVADTHKMFRFYKPKITLEEGIAQAIHA